MKPIDLSKVKKTKCGYPVRILCADRIGSKPIVTLITYNGEEWPHSHRLDGRALITGEDSKYDLVEEQEVIEVDFWVNWYDDDAYIYLTKELADKNCGPFRLACFNIKRPVTVGEGLK